MLQNRSSHSGADTTCSEPGLCYDRLTTQCAPCVKPARHSRSDISCSLPGLCYDHQSKQCVHCGPRSTSCHLPSLCYDRLVDQCVSCEKMQRNTEKETTPTPHAADPACSSLLFGIYIAMGLVLILAAVLCVVILKQKRKKRMRGAEKENSTDFRCCEERNAEENEKCVIAFENEPPKGHSCSPGDGDPEILRCPHSNDALSTARDDTSKREVQHIAMAGSDVTEAASLTSCDKKCNPTFPLPATELGATVLVTTKTTQESVIWDEESSS
ncbi:tumor necrosis factor receptor superfamily member 13C isoform X2 [Zootoca vivipara]|uniref:tumor necrosis factor receptor superfamily member 13C isoform X2 n=1 Tax=Zootoca vivipara TaxID=8524 RepID=UPI001590E34E|nr:tumor necrosis factor receptor superfamily member 13C isoform X2 [Zootoca vivipara]